MRAPNLGLGMRLKQPLGRIPAIFPRRGRVSFPGQFLFFQSTLQLLFLLLASFHFFLTLFKRFLGSPHNVTSQTAWRLMAQKGKGIPPVEKCLSA